MNQLLSDFFKLISGFFPDLIKIILSILLKDLLTVIYKWSMRKITLWLRKIRVYRAIEQDRSNKLQPSDPTLDKNFNCYRIGNIEIPAMQMHGTPEQPYRIDEVQIEFEPSFRHEKDDYPKDLLLAKNYLVKTYQQRYKLEPIGTANYLPRLDEVSSAGDQGNKRGNLRIRLSFTTFEDFIATNRSLDKRILPAKGLISQFRSNQSIREVYVSPPYTDLSKSVLANPPAVDISVISRNLNQAKDQLIIRQRSKKVASYQGYYQVSATGYMSTEDRELSDAPPNPFYTAVRETKEEISYRLVLEPKDFKLIGLSINWQDFLPVFYGYFEIGVSVQELLGDFKRDAYEGNLFAIDFDPKTVLSHIVREKWEPQAALAAISTLLAFYPFEEVKKTAEKLHAKKLQDFFEEVP